MANENDKINIPNRAVALTIVASNPINENWDYIEENLNKNKETAEQVYDKIDYSEKGISEGVATLTIEGKLPLNQLPKEARNNVYIVSSLFEQLDLTAYRGDICKRTDTNKSYFLQNDDPTQSTNWIEIGSMTSGSEIEGNPPYTNLIKTDRWQLDNSTNTYYVSIPSEEHNQGSKKYLFVDTKTSLGETLYNNYTVESDGTITLFSNIPIDLNIIISDLSGNCSNSIVIPYCIHKGNIINNKEDIFVIKGDQLLLSTDTPIKLVDGFGYVKTILTVDNTDVSKYEDGFYYCFIDSLDIQDTHLNKIVLIKASDYKGVVNQLPFSGSLNQRCYVAFDSSYEFINGWRKKAFTPIGVVQILQGVIYKTFTLPYNVNGVNTVFKSNDKDYLYGNVINGFTYSYIDGSITIGQGSCLNQNKTRIINNTTVFVKNMEEWQETGNGGLILDDEPNTTITVYEVTNGSMIGYTSVLSEDDYVPIDISIYSDINLTNLLKTTTENEFTYTGNVETVIQSEDEYIQYNIYIIENYLQETNICISRSDTPTLPNGYTEYRKVGSFIGYNKTILDFTFIKDEVYLKSPIQLLNQPTQDKTELLTQFLDADSIKLIFEGSSTTKIYSNDQLVNVNNNNFGIVDVPNVDIEIQNETSQNIKVSILGYKDNRKII